MPGTTGALSIFAIWNTSFSMGLGLFYSFSKLERYDGPPGGGGGGAVRKALGQPRRRLAGPCLVKIGISLEHDSS